MFEQFNSKQMVALSRQFADTAFKAHGLAIAGMERAFDLQIKAFENRVNATVEFWTEASEIRDLEGARKLSAKGATLAKDAAEKAYVNAQEIVGLTIKTNEAIGELVKGSLENANETFVKPVTVATKKAK
jgi:hypothetical protein